MNAATTVTPEGLADFLLNVALVRPVFIWGPPGIGKSSVVQQFAAALGLPCVSLASLAHLDDKCQLHPVKEVNLFCLLRSK
jgi:replication-associated recombination protein RarA